MSAIYMRDVVYRGVSLCFIKKPETTVVSGFFLGAAQQIRTADLHITN